MQIRSLCLLVASKMGLNKMTNIEIPRVSDNMMHRIKHLNHQRGSFLLCFVLLGF